MESLIAQPTSARTISFSNIAPMLTVKRNPKPASFLKDTSSKSSNPLLFSGPAIGAAANLLGALPAVAVAVPVERVAAE